MAGSVLAPVEPRVEADGTPLRSSPLVLALHVRMRLSPSDAVTPADALPLSFFLTVGRHTLSYPRDFGPWGTQRAIAGVTLAAGDIAHGFPLQRSFLVSGP